ncbi:hypothetical protein OENI_260037 [Oenococcus oeni]|nr:hypothetical protein OENI_260037 [Oenococcus oeni]
MIPDLFIYANSKNCYGEINFFDYLLSQTYSSINYNKKVHYLNYDSERGKLRHNEYIVFAAHLIKHESNKIIHQSYQQFKTFFDEV